MPAYLRHQGRLRNRRMPKAEVERAVRMVWSAKTRAEQQLPAPARSAAGGAADAAPDGAACQARLSAGSAAPDDTTLGAVFAGVAADMHADRLAATEWCYNVMDGCRRRAAPPGPPGMRSGRRAATAQAPRRSGQPSPIPRGGERCKVSK